MSTSYYVDGMTCGGCARSVTSAIKTKAPNAEVFVDLAAKQVTVSGFDDEAAIRDAVEGAGFDFGGAVSQSA